MKPFELSQEGFFKTALDDPIILSGGFWDELRVFLAVAKLGSFTKAGSYLGISTPSVSRNVKRLQDVLQTQLIVPGRTGAKLTDDGMSLANSLAEMDYKFFSIASNFRKNTRKIEGVIRVCVTEGLAGVFLASKLADFHEKFPGITVHLKTPINIASLRENRADIMIGFEPVVAADINSIKLGYLHLVPIASELYIEKKGNPTRDNISNHVFVDSQFYEAKTGLWDDWQNLIAKGRIAAHCDSSLSYAMSIIGGLGIGLLGNYVLSDRSLRPLDLGVHAKVPIFLFGLTERLQARPVQLVMQWLTETFAPENQWFAPELNLQQDSPTQFLTVMRALRGVGKDGAG